MKVHFADIELFCIFNQSTLIFVLQANIQLFAHEVFKVFDSLFSLANFAFLIQLLALEVLRENFFKLYTLYFHVTNFDIFISNFS